MEKFIQLGKEFGLEGEMLLQSCARTRRKKEKRRKEEREEKRREEEREEKLSSLKNTKKRNIGS